MRKKVCVRCGKILEVGTKCTCSHYYPKSQKKEKKETEKALSRKRWKDKRERILRRDKHFCQRCRIKYGIMNFENLQIHHIKSREHYPELMYEDDNLITLCKSCNIQMGTNDKLDFKWEVPKEDDIKL